MRFAACRLLLVILAVVALGGTAGCAASFVYDRADRLTHRWLGDYVTLDATQEAMLDAGLADLHLWHRHEQLPAYAGWLRGIAARLQAVEPVSDGELRALGKELGAFWRELAGTALPLMTQLGAGLRDAQVAELIATLREEHETEFEMAGRRSDDWRQQRRARSMERFMRRWTGPLTDAQRDAASGWAAGLEPTLEASFENRAGWIDALEAALGRRSDADALQAAGEILLVAPTRRWSPEYAGLVERNTARTASFLADFINDLDEGQRARAVSGLERVAAELERLSQDAA